MEEFEDYEYPNYDEDLFAEEQELIPFKDIDDYTVTMPEYPEVEWTTTKKAETTQQETTKKKKKTTTKEATTNQRIIYDPEETYTTVSRKEYNNNNGDDKMSGIFEGDYSVLIITIAVCLAILPYILFVVMASHVSVIKRQLKETNEILIAMIKEQRRVNDNKPNYYKQDGQAQQMDSIEPPKL